MSISLEHPSSKNLGIGVRNEFPIFERNILQRNGHDLPFAYLDSAVSTQKPRAVIASMVRHMESDYGSVHRGAYSVSVRSSQMYEEVRSKVAQFLGKSFKKEHIVFTKGTTEALNILAYGLGAGGLDENSRIVVPMAEHHANIVPWQQTALRKDCEIAYIPLEGRKGSSLQLDLKAARKSISKNTKIVAFAHVGNVLGQTNPVAELTALAKQVGAWVVVDCAQSAVYLQEDLFAMGVDALCFSAHKIYGPSGVGVLALREELMEKIPPLLFGGGMVSSVTLEESTWVSGAAKFEGGTPPMTEVVGLGAAIDWIQRIGKKKIHDHCASMNRLFLDQLRDIPAIEIFSPETGGETLLSFRHKSIHAHDLATILDLSNVAVRAGHHCAWPLVQFLGVDALVRSSCGVYTDADHIEAAVKAIKNCEKMF